MANRANQYSPFGSSTWEAPIPVHEDPTKNGPWKQTINLSPVGQSLLDSLQSSQLGVAGLQDGATQSVRNTMGTPFQYSGPGITGGVAPRELQTSIGSQPGVQRSVGMPDVQGQIDTSGVSAIPEVNEQARQAAADASYGQATSRLDPQFAQAQAAMETKLRNQGLVPGGEAYTNAMRDFNFSRNDAYSNARNRAVQEGLQNQQAQFGMGLAANQAGFGQAATQGQFANQAAGQEFGMGLQNAGLFNQSGAQQFGQDVAAGNFGNAAQTAMFNQGLASGQFGNTAAQQALAQQMALRGIPLNELNAIRTGSQMTSPVFPTYGQQQTVPGPNFSGATAAQGTWDQGLYNQQVGQQNEMTKGLFSLGSAAAPLMFSDSRLKSNVERVGTHPLGIGIYEYDIFGRREIGVMAQELLPVMPEAVLQHPSGYLMVDYGRLV